MKILKSWLKDYIDYNLTDEELAERFSASTLPIDDSCEVDQLLNKNIESDTIFDVEVSPNRSDCLSHIGVAREIGAIVGKKIVIEKSKVESKSDGKLNVKIEDEKLCPQYYARIIKGVKIGPSSEKIQNRLKILGLKPINNVVDITNYIMFDLGQPLHAFDLDKINGSEIVVRTGRDERMDLLDGGQRVIDNEMLAICDTEKPIAVAGVMGGANSEVSEQTVDIVLEGAEFERRSIRKTAKKLGLATEASFRFERGIDSGGILEALNKATKIILESAGGEVVQTVFAGYEPKQNKLNLNLDKIICLLGIEIKLNDATKILESMGFVVNGEEITVPMWRHDILIWQDLAEEIGRLHGLDKIKATSLPDAPRPVKSQYYILEHIKDIIASCGFSEMENYAFLSKKDIDAAQISATNLLEIANPLQQENKFLRNSLIPGLLKNVAKNPAADQIAVFEIGHVFNQKEETNNLGVLASGKNARNLIENVRDTLKKIGISIDAAKEISRDDLTRYKIKKPIVYTFEINLDAYLAHIKIDDKDLDLKVSNKKTNYRNISKYPPAVRDLAIVVDNEMNAHDISLEILGTSNSIIIAELFDEFSSDKLGKDKKSLAYHLWMQDLDSAMTDEQVNDIFNKVMITLEQKYQAQLRN